MPVHRHPIVPPTVTDDLRGIPLDDALTQRLRRSYEAVRAEGTRLADLFYASLFARAPELRPLFRTDPRVQAQKLLSSLDAIVKNLEAPGENAAMLAALGERHAGYGARPEHYDLVVELLVDAMRQLLGDRADPRTLDEWRTALRLVSAQMIAAAERARAQRPPAGDTRA